MTSISVSNIVFLQKQVHFVVIWHAVLRVSNDRKSTQNVFEDILEKNLFVNYQ